MDYNQQRRTRNANYHCGRQMNYGRQQDCGCDSRAQEMEYNRAARQAGCDTCARQMERDHSSCSCQHSCTYMRQKGHLEESASYPIGMSYTPWQSWGCTYDGHRGLMSGTIFPELDKPFCAAGRCSR